MATNAADDALLPCPFCKATLRMIGTGSQFRHEGGRTDCILAGLTVHDCDVPYWNRRPSADEAGTLAKVRECLWHLEHHPFLDDRRFDNDTPVSVTLGTLRRYIAALSAQPAAKDECLKFDARTITLGMLYSLADDLALLDPEQAQGAHVLQVAAKIVDANTVKKSRVSQQQQPAGNDQ